MGGALIALVIMGCLFAICAGLFRMAVDGPNHEDLRNQRAAAVSATLHGVIKDNLYCARCQSRVNVRNCTGWDEDGNVWDNCQGKVPLIDDISWNPARSQGGE